MEYEIPRYKDFQHDFTEIAEQFSLNPDHLKIEFYAPQTQAIMVEKVEDQQFQIHINLEESRIVSIKRLTNGVNGNGEHLKEKYRKFMK